MVVMATFAGGAMAKMTAEIGRQGLKNDEAEFEKCERRSKCNGSVSTANGFPGGRFPRSETNAVGFKNVNRTGGQTAKLLRRGRTCFPNPSFLAIAVILF